MSRYEKEWEKWGGRDPYFAVLTDERFRTANLNEKERDEFFDSGRSYVEFLLSSIHSRFDASFSAREVLDFGCGVGRLAIPFAKTGAEVLGVDVSRSMIDQASANAEQENLPNLRFEHLTKFERESRKQFDLVNAYITFQHVPRRDGERLLRKLVESVREDGFAAIHLLHARPGRFWKPAADWARRSVPGANMFANLLLGKPAGTPHMQMNVYDVNRFMGQLQTAGFGHAYLVFTDHGGYRGVLIIAQRVSRQVP